MQVEPFSTETGTAMIEAATTLDVDALLRPLAPWIVKHDAEAAAPEKAKPSSSFNIDFQPTDYPIADFVRRVADGAAGRSISLDFLRIGARVAPVVGARVARVRTAHRHVGSPQRRIGGAQHLQHSFPIRHRRHRQVDGLHAVVVDGVDVRATFY